MTARRRLAWLVLVSVAILGRGGLVGPCAAETFQFDERSAEIVFTYYVGLIPQTGRFTGLKGAIVFDPKAPGRSSISAVIPTDTLTADRFRDELRGGDFFNVASYPEIRFKSRSALLTANGAEFAGDLTLRGVTHPIKLKMSPAALLALQPTSAGQARVLTANTQIRRSDFNMTALSLLVDDEIDIEIKTALLQKR